MPAPLPRTTEPDVTTRPTGAPSAAAEINPAAYGGLAALGRSLKDVGPGFAALLGADEEGEKAVTRDASGNLQVETRIPWNFYNEAFNHAALARYAAEADNDIQSNIQNLAITHASDPVKFRAAANAYLDGFVPRAPSALRRDLRTIGANRVTEQEGGLARAKAARDIQTGREAILSQIDVRNNELVALAGQGGTETQAYRDKLAEVQNLFTNLTGNPLFGVSQAQADGIMSHMQSRAKIQALMQPFLDRGVGSMSIIQAAINDPAANLSPEDRQRFKNMLEGEFDHRRVMSDRARSLSRQARSDQGDVVIKDMIGRVARGKPPPSVEEVMAAQAVLDPSQFNAALNAATAPATHDDVGTVHALMPRVYTGTATDADVTLALRQGRITPSTAAEFYNKIGQQVPSGVRRAFDDMFKALDRQGGPFDRADSQASISARQRDAQYEFSDFLRQFDGKPPPTEQQIRAKVNQIIGAHLPSRASTVPPVLKPILGNVPYEKLPNLNFDQIRANLSRQYKARYQGNWDKARQDPEFRRAMQYLRMMQDRAQRIAPE